VAAHESRADLLVACRLQYCWRITYLKQTTTGIIYEQAITRRAL